MLNNKKSKGLIISFILCLIFANINIGAESRDFNTISLCEHSFNEEVFWQKASKGYVYKSVCKNCTVEKYKIYDGLLTFVDDDGKADALYSWEDIIDTTGIEMTSAVIPSKVKETTKYTDFSSFAGWDDILRLKEKGIDFVNHTYSHQNLTTLSYENVIEDLVVSRYLLNQKGLNGNVLVYPYNTCNSQVISTVEKFFDGAVVSGGVVNKNTFSNQFNINRVDINSKTITKDIKFPNTVVACKTVMPIENLKSYAEKAVSNNGWLVFMSHASNSIKGKYYFDDDSKKVLIDFIEYIKKQNKLKIVTLSHGVNNLYNNTNKNSVITVGNTSFFDCSGNTTLVIPESVTSIKANAFYNANTLQTVVIPKEVVKIENNAFDNLKNITVYCYKNSAADKFARKKGVSVVYLDTTVKLSYTSTVYNGKEQKPKVSVYNGNGKLLSSNYYSVSYPNSAIKAGTYKITVTFKGVYSGKKQANFKISPITKGITYKIKTSVLSYNGKALIPTVEVKNRYGTKLTKGVHYSLKYYTSDTNVGKHKVAIIMKGNYSGSKVFYLQINPKKVAISKITPTKRALKVYLPKKTSQVTGYKIQYSSTNFKSCKTVTTKNNSVTISGLVSKRKYKVRVRTYKVIDGKYYYSAWSEYKQEKVK